MNSLHKQIVLSLKVMYILNGIQYPSSGKVKFLQCGRQKGTTNREGIPVNYILSEYLDMMRVKVIVSFKETRQFNCDELQNNLGAWKRGEFISPISRPCSLNKNAACLLSFLGTLLLIPVTVTNPRSIM